jgi:hypothetical protein
VTAVRPFSAAITARIFCDVAASAACELESSETAVNAIDAVSGCRSTEPVPLNVSVC